MFFEHIFTENILFFILYGITGVVSLVCLLLLILYALVDTDSILIYILHLIELVLFVLLLAKHCVDTQLYLQHDLTLQQLAQAIGTNRSYLSQYFSRQGITYNTYINNLRINHFISHYQEVAAAGQPVVAQRLASESGYRSYSTFSLAFKQRTGLNLTAWMRQSAE